MNTRDESSERAITDRVQSDRRARQHGESDAPADEASARSRETGGVAQRQPQDQNSSTGTTPNEEFVGRASGDETGDPETSGAEARAGRDDEGDEPEGALRKE